MIRSDRADDLLMERPYPVEDEGGAVDLTSNLLLESDFSVLLESGDLLLLEA